MALPALGKPLSAVFGGQYDIVSWDPRGSASFYSLYGYLLSDAHVEFTLSIAPAL